MATSAFIRAFWSASSESDKRDGAFLSFLTLCGWCNVVSGRRADEATRKWRNRALGDYLGVEYEDINTLAQEVSRRWPKIGRSQARKLLNSFTGITHYYKPFRPTALRFTTTHTQELSSVFRKVSSPATKPEQMVRETVNALCALPLIKTPKGGATSLVNAVTPALACLDPRRRLPIMNSRTAELLRLIGKHQDAEGAVSLSRLIGQQGIRNSFELDRYSQQHLPTAPKENGQAMVAGKDVGHKSEEDSYADLAKRKIRIRKRHNKLINKFRTAVEWQYRLEESRFDVLIPVWKNGRMLLIEAKVSSSGPTGRSQIRQAIGQLFDYRRTYFQKDVGKVKLAVLLPSKPTRDILGLLKSLEIGVLWFNSGKIHGTFAL